jgi:hypothetical protein
MFSDSHLGEYRDIYGYDIEKKRQQAKWKSEQVYFLLTRKIWEN